MTRRIVLLHPSGLRQILGAWDGPTPSPLTTDAGECRLLYVTPTYVVYQLIEPYEDPPPSQQ